MGEAERQGGCCLAVRAASLPSLVLTFQRPDQQASAPSKKRQKGGGEKVQCSHILAKHRDSRNPKSWRQPDGIDCTKEEAKQRLRGYLERLDALEDVAQIKKVFAGASVASEGR